MTSPEAGDERAAPARPRRRLVAVSALGAAAIAAATVAVTSSGGESAEAVDASQATGTAKISRNDLVETDSVDGTLGYSDARAVINRLAGTVTAAPREGDVVQTNQTLYEVDGKAIYLLDGASPAYRTLEPGLSGDDVRELERNLRELGLDPDEAMSVDGSWDAGTTAAVKRWQERKGMEQDGSIEAGRVVFQPGSRRVGTIAIDVGGNAGGGSGGGGNAPAGALPLAAGTSATSSLMTTTSTKRIVTVELGTNQLDLAAEGDTVSVDLPDGKRADARIVSVGQVARKIAAAGAQNADDAPTTVKLIIKLEQTAGVGFDQAPVDVRLEQRRAKDVLSVPVTALLAREGGRFAVEVREDDKRRLVEVETGLFTSGDVEIAGEGLRPGMLVTNAEV